MPGMSVGVESQYDGRDASVNLCLDVKVDIFHLQRRPDNCLELTQEISLTFCGVETSSLYSTRMQQRTVADTEDHDRADDNRVSLVCIKVSGKTNGTKEFSPHRRMGASLPRPNHAHTRTHHTHIRPRQRRTRGTFLSITFVSGKSIDNCFVEICHDVQQQKAK